MSGVPNRSVVVFENVSASVGGYDISSILELHLNATANDIPFVTLVVDGGHSNAGKPEAASALALSEVRSLLDVCRAMVKKSGATLNLSLTARAVGGRGDTQTMSISGWMLTDVSIAPVRRGGLVTVALTFMHPICKSHYGGVVPGLLASGLALDSVSGDNPLEVFVSALKTYGESAKRSSPLPVGIGGADSLRIRENLLTRLASATAALKSSLRWTGGGLPARNQLAGWEQLHRYALALYAMPSGGTSVFQRFARVLVPECSLAVGGDYTSASLDVGPFMPWADESASVDDSDILGVQFPQSDPSPISGVRVIGGETGESALISYHLDTSQALRRTADVFYVPSEELQAEYLYGPIHQFQEPGWLTVMKGYAASRSNTGSSDLPSARYGKLILPGSKKAGTATFSSVAEKLLPSFSAAQAMMACAKAYYETSLMKDWAFSVETRLMFRTGGALICPGQVIGFRSTGTTVVAGYVNSVTHTISVPSRTATTVIECTHPRFGAPPNGIKGSNALYS